MLYSRDDDNQAELKSQILHLKRHKLGDLAGEDDESSARKRRKMTNDYDPLSLLGEVAAGIIPISLHGLVLSSVAIQKSLYVSWCTEVSCSPEVEELKSNGRDSIAKMINGKVEVQRPPLVRTSRGGTPLQKDL